ncbi:MAG: glutamyl-tRNA reductase, partial [Pseudonocardiales bacterium]
MSLLVVGLSHRSAPVQVLERAVVASTETGKLLDELLSCANVTEALLLSTCNRVEIYAVVQTFHGGLDDVTAVLARQAGTPLDDLSGHLYVHYAAAAVEHLFSVACGLDSMVVGVPQFLGGVRASWGAAGRAGAVGSTLHELVQQALRVGKRAHTETGIDAEGASVVSEALADAAAALTAGDGRGLASRRALVIGAGSMGGLAAAQLRRAGVAEIVLANRSSAGALRLAARCVADGTPARVVGLDALDSEVAAVDVVICCTGALDPVLGVAQVAGRGAPAPLVVCDLGLPRDVEAG